MRISLVFAALAAMLATMVTGGPVAAEDQYVGDETCSLCHAEKYAQYIQSGHPWKLSEIGGQEPAPDFWPHTPVPPLPETLTEGWSGVGWVIGNFFWKARFVELDGFIHTGDAVQWNLATQEFVGYHPGEVKPYSCGKCHTTGYDPEIDPEWPEGIIGTWAQPGVRCEACHGPGHEHVVSQTLGDGSIMPEGGKACDDCHQRDSDFRMPWKGGFMRHHQQGEDYSHSPHAGILQCESCHEPHKSTVYPEQGGMLTECTDCHQDAEKNDYVVAGMEEVACIDCHMPNIGKSATSPSEFVGDVRGHLFQIMTDPIAAVDNTYVADGTTFWNQDGNGDAFVTLDYACLGCHLEHGDSMTLEEAAEFAEGIHTRSEPPPHPDGDTWLVKAPYGYLYEGFTVTFEQFAGITIVYVEYPDGETSVGIGMEWDGVIYWMDMTNTIFFGNINRNAGTMSGIAFFADGVAIWFGEKQ